MLLLGVKVVVERKTFTKETRLAEELGRGRSRKQSGGGVRWRRRVQPWLRTWRHRHMRSVPGHSLQVPASGRFSPQLLPIRLNPSGLTLKGPGNAGP